MRISTKYGFTFLCMPKCASTSVEHALQPYSDLLTRGKTVSLKHTNYRNYSKYIEPYLEKVTGERPEVICIMREPLDWLHSWYRYRKRESIQGNPLSTANISFDEFCQLYIKRKASVGRQFNFIRAKNGTIGPDRLFPYEKLELLRRYLEEKIGHEIDFPEMNVSPKEELEISSETKRKFYDYLKEDYEVYNSII